MEGFINKVSSQFVGTASCVLFVVGVSLLNSYRVGGRT